MGAHAAGSSTIWVQGANKLRLKALLRDPRPLLEKGYPNPGSMDDVIAGLLDYLEKVKA